MVIEKQSIKQPNIKTILQGELRDLRHPTDYEELGQNFQMIDDLEQSLVALINENPK